MGKQENPNLIKLSTSGNLQGKISCWNGEVVQDIQEFGYTKTRIPGNGYLQLKKDL